VQRVTDETHKRARTHARTHRSMHLCTHARTHARTQAFTHARTHAGLHAHAPSHTQRTRARCEGFGTKTDSVSDSCTAAFRSECAVKIRNRRLGRR
jgi:hypothetical protein